MIYLIGSLRNPQVPIIAEALRGAGHKVFDEWYAAGPHADDAWRDYEKAKGATFEQALVSSRAAQHVFDFDYKWLRAADVGVLITPAGKSGHLELGWMLGQGKRGYVLLTDTAERWDVMYKFAHGVAVSVPALIVMLKGRK